jgi:hypothetical protein
LAKQMAIQYPQVEFYAVSCLEHRGMCKDYSIQGYPALLTFGAGSKEGKPIKYGAKKTVDFLAKTLGLDDDDTNTHISRRLQDGDGDEEDKDGDTKSDDEDKDSDEEDKDSDEEDEDKDSGDEDKDSDEEDKDSGDEDKDGANKSDADKDGNEDKDEDKDSDEDKDEDKDSDEDKDGANKSDADKDGDEDKDSDEKNSEFGKADKDGKDSEDSDDKDGDEPDDSEEEEENEDDDGKDEDESESESEDVPPPRAANRPVVAGAAKGRLERKDMDRWKTQMAGLKKEHEDRRKRLGGIISPPIPKHTRGAVEKTTSETMTDKMKAFSPGTPEYEKRKNDLLERVAAGRAKMEARGKPGSTITKDTVLKKESLPFSKDVRKQSFVQKQVGKVPIVKRLVRMTPEEALINDASRSFVHSLRYGVFMSDEPLTLPRKMALQNWLEFLSVSLPPEWGLHRIIDDVRRQINFVAQADKNLHAVLDAHTSTMPRGTWSFSCTGLGNKATTKSQGFSCGFWKLLHTATVGVAEHNGGLNLVKSGMVGDTQKTFSPIEAADTIKDYIAMFFNCEECKRHFVEHYNNCANNRRCDRLTDDVETATTGDWKELALWMWEVHNEVSVRIVSEKRKKQLQRGLNAVGSLDEVMVVWPTIGDCFRCFEDDGTWDEPEVFARLEYAYWYVHSAFLDTTSFAGRHVTNLAMLSSLCAGRIPSSTPRMIDCSSLKERAHPVWAFCGFSCFLCFMLFILLLQAQVVPSIDLYLPPGDSSRKAPKPRAVVPVPRSDLFRSASSFI